MLCFVRTFVAGCLVFSASAAGLAAAADDQLSVCFVDGEGEAVEVSNCWMVTVETLAMTLGMPDPVVGRSSVERLRSLGQLLRRGEDGQWHGDVPTENSYVFAESPQRNGSAQLGPEQRRLEVWMRPRQSVVVRVHDAHGRSAPGVAVELRRVWRGFVSGLFLEATTDADGVARFDELVLLGPPRERRAWQIRPRVAGVGLERRVESAVGESNVQFTLPATGRLVVPVDEGRDVVTPQVKVVTVTWGGRRESRLKRPVVGGVARLEHVEVGVPFSVTAGLGEAGRVMHPGIAQEGDEVLVPISLVPERPPCALIGRVVDEEGEPLDLSFVTLEALSAYTPFAGGSGRRVCAVTSDGSFRLEDARDALGFWDGDWISIRTVPIHEEGPIHSLVRVERWRRGTTVFDLGECAPTRGPTWVSGRVVSPEGLPVQGARVRLHRQNALPLLTIGPTKADGSFVSVGPHWARSTVEVTLSSPTWSGTLRSGSSLTHEDLEVVAEPRGCFSCPAWTVEFPRGELARLDGVLMATSLASGAKPPMRLPLAQREGGRLVFPALKAGTYTLSVRWRGLTLAEFPNLAIVDGVERRDPRVEAWDATTQTRQESYDVVAEDGTPFRDLKIRVARAGEPFSRWLDPRPPGQRPNLGFNAVLPLAEDVEALVDAVGGRRIVVPLDGRRVITLPPEPVATFLLAPETPPLELPASVRLAVRAIPTSPRFSGPLTARHHAQLESYAVFEDGVARVPLDDPGDYIIEWCVAPVDALPREMRLLESAKGPRVHLTASDDAPQVFGVRFPESARAELAIKARTLAAAID